MKANLGCGTNILSGWDNIDWNIHERNIEVVHTDILMYLRNCPANYLDEVRAWHILEHLPDLDAVMSELARVCLPNAKLDIIVPVANTLWAVADPTHKSLFNHRTFEYYCIGYETSYGRSRDFRLISRHYERSENEWFDGIEWQVVNLHVILERI